MASADAGRTGARGVFGRMRASSGGVDDALPASRRCAVLPILDLHRARLVPLQWGKKKKKLKKIYELQLRFSYPSPVIRYASRTSFGALADITVTTTEAHP